MFGGGGLFVCFCVCVCVFVCLFAFSGLGMFWNRRSEEGQYKVKELHVDRLKKLTVMEKKGVSHVTRDPINSHLTEDRRDVFCSKNS